MKIEIETDESDDRLVPRPRRRAPDYRSTGFRLRLLTLFAALVLVLIMMKEAGKPERWEWMGLDRVAPNQNPAGQTNYTAAENLPTDPTLANAHATEAENHQIETAGICRRLFANLDTQQQVSILWLLRAIETGISVPESEREAVAAAWEACEVERSRLDQLPANFQQRWQERVAPTVAAALKAQDYTVAGQQAVLELQPFLDDAIFARIEDATAVGHLTDAPAWIRLWQKVEQDQLTDAQPVTRVQLMSQPDVYHGRVVNVEGWIRSARYIDRPIKSLDIPGYYELWVRPADTNAGAFCIYVLELPDPFPDVSREYVKLNERFGMSAIFFKNRNYVAADESIQVCPLLLGRTIRWNPAAVGAETASAWRPDGITLTAIVLGLMVLAGLIAWAARRSVVTTPFQPGAHSRQVINQSLQSLQNDPGVQTDAEKVANLKQQLENASSTSDPTVERADV